MFDFLFQIKMYTPSFFVNYQSLLTGNTKHVSSICDLIENSRNADCEKSAYYSVKGKIIDLKINTYKGCWECRKSVYKNCYCDASVFDMTMLKLEIDDGTGKISNVVCFEKVAIKLFRSFGAEVCYENMEKMKQEGEKIIIGDKCLMRIRVKSQKNNEGSVNVGFVVTDVKALNE